jgi:hypothetical protein
VGAADGGGRGLGKADVFDFSGSGERLEWSLGVDVERGGGLTLSA